MSYQKCFATCNRENQKKSMLKMTIQWLSHTLHLQHNVSKKSFLALKFISIKIHIMNFHLLEVANNLSFARVFWLLLFTNSEFKNLQNLIMWLRIIFLNAICNFLCKCNIHACTGCGGAWREKQNVHFCHDTVRTIIILTNLLRAVVDLIQGAFSNRTSQELTKRVKSHLISAAKLI